MEYNLKNGTKFVKIDPVFWNSLISLSIGESVTDPELKMAVFSIN
jgi:hypothetical protein